MEEEAEKRGPVKKGKKGWPINPFGVAVLLVLGIVAVFLIAKPLLNRSSQGIPNSSYGHEEGKITFPASGEIIKDNNLEIKFSLNQQESVEKVQFWAHTYANNSWEMIGETQTAPYTYNWEIPESYNNKAIAITSHIIKTDGETIKDPGGWVEGIIILSDL